MVAFILIFFLFVCGPPSLSRFTTYYYFILLLLRGNPSPYGFVNTYKQYMVSCVMSKGINCLTHPPTLQLRSKLK